MEHSSCKLSNDIILKEVVRTYHERLTNALLTPDELSDEGLMLLLKSVYQEVCKKYTS
ncbi:TPA: hypothetical protein ACX6QF_001619 [Photobacterium damselae]|uniref:Helix-turn-helix conjugative transposon-like domain-containing protein n=2 Tax=Photobacterium damselae TaxID=38293 RepID=A0A2X1WHW9_PHODM|nr:hypothetical protein [Photobacterium damselae]EHA1080484.1 hypothetical protein [Photobacterium damselae]MCG3813396.1 hypothetical protein [Photobacterium damselae]MCG3815725.1 hypothetical protein [Photobacterium damselae]MCG3824252.1 hypothetical protein [Photobacterium damselae]NVO61942.1 hypothetical protein [Photobacterium damselae subsp. damselae]